MKRIITLNSGEWNRLKGLLTNPEYQYIKFHGKRIIATNGKVILIKKLEKQVTEKGKPFYINVDDMAKVIGDKSIVRIKVTDDSVFLRYMENKPKKIKYAFDKIEFPNIKGLVEREKKSGKNMEVSISKNTLFSLLNCVKEDSITIRIHSDSVLAKWESGDESGYFVKLKQEK